MTRRLIGTALAALGLLVFGSEAQAQLLSPGRLAEAHSELAGLRNCTSCHELGSPGISADRCLSCHEALRDRVAAGNGFHATVSREDCADCHQDHLGAEFDLLHLDEETFDHSQTGYGLLQSHESVACRDCHQPSHIRDAAVVALKSERGSLRRTFLGLRADCAGCHREDSPHGDQFESRGCVDCHDEGVWEEPPRFDHGETAFPLEGLHAQAACVDCHGSGIDAIYTPIEFGTCNACHEDSHAGAMAGACASCHSTVGWATISSGDMERFFDHSTTGFPLAGAHRDAACTTCHQPGRPPRTSLLRMSYAAGTQSATYPQPLHDSCRACHVEQHTARSNEARWTDCEACHSNSAWAPSPFDLAGHEESAFPLTGAHVVAPCLACHLDTEKGHQEFTLAIQDQSCASCHVADDPHEGVYAAMTCEQCHVTEAFDLAVFDHALVLDVPDPRPCASCHSEEDPHAGQFPERDCASCHGTETFSIEPFDHAGTDFPLDGAHDALECGVCHLAEPGSPPFVRYRPLGTECADCHAGL